MASNLGTLSRSVAFVHLPNRSTGPSHRPHILKIKAKALQGLLRLATD